MSGATMTSSSSTPGQSAPNVPVSITSSQAIGQWSTCSSWCERCRRNPTCPDWSTARRTRVRQPSPFRHAGRLDRHVALDAGHPVELLDDPRRLECSLRRQLDVLEVAAAAATGTGERAWWWHTVGGSAEYLRRHRPG